MSGVSDHIAVIGAGAAHFADALAKHFADVVVLPPFDLLDGRIASHPDTLLAKVGKTVIVSEAYAAHASREISRIAAHAPVRLGKTIPRSPYPQDVAYNEFQHGGLLYARTDTLDGAVTDAAEAQGLPLRHIRQGYAGCSALSCEDVVLTADSSIAFALEADGAAVVRLTPGGIRLPGYDYGFIGGAAGYCAHTAVFFGKLDRHPDGIRIRTALELYGIRAISLGTESLTDYGGILTVPVKTT